MRVISFLFLLLLEPCLGCLRVEFTSGSLGTLSFDQLPIEYQYSPDEVKTGRPTYFNEEHQLYMYHIIMNKERGRWIVSNSINPEGLGNAIAYIESWAVVPYLTKEITDTKDWNIFWKKLDDWGPDPATRVTCEIDETVYFESHPKLAPELAAFYVQRVSQSQQTEYPIYTQIKPSPDAKQYYLYKLDGKWLFGDELGIDCKYLYCYFRLLLHGSTYVLLNLLQHACPLSNPRRGPPLPSLRRRSTSTTMMRAGGRNSRPRWCR